MNKTAAATPLAAREGEARVVRLKGELEDARRESAPAALRFATLCRDASSGLAELEEAARTVLDAAGRLAGVAHQVARLDRS